VLFERIGRKAIRLLVCSAAATAIIPTPASADPYLEASGPAAAPVAVMVVHGGAWIFDEHGYFVATRPTAERYAREYRTFNVGYAAGGRSVGDVVAAYDRVRASVGPDEPICVSGESAGGQLAMMLAEARDVACTISAAGPSDLTIPTNQALQGAAAAAFGYQSENLAAASPRLHTDTFRGRLLLVHAVNDPMVPLQQSQLMAQALPGAELVELADGPANFVHRQVDPAALTDFYRRERAFIAEAAAGWHAARPAPPPTPSEPGAAAPAPSPSEPGAQPRPAAASPPERVQEKRRGAHHKRRKVMTKSRQRIR
jgi:acetyl esterase/lipase